MQEREWYVRDDAETDWAYGERPEQRDIEALLGNGLVIVDKPNGPTSNQISAWTKTVLERGKTGHAGTLDPHATGVLPVVGDDGTRVLGPLSTADKTYVTRITLDDAQGRDAVAHAAQEFVGTVTQVPPEKSAVKREERERELYSLEVLEVDGPDLLLRLDCEKGFYVRTFAEQLGEALGTTGELTELRRTRAGAFTEDDAHTLQDLADAYRFWQEDDDPDRLRGIVLPVEAGVRHLPKVVVKDSAVAALTHGADLGGGGIATLTSGIDRGDLVALLTLKGELVATAHAETDTATMQETDETVAVLDRVYMDKDTYPKQW